MRVTAAVLWREGRILLARRTAPEWLAEKWEFPGGKFEPGETAQECLARELSEELGMETEVGEHLLTCAHAYAEFDVQLEAYHVKWLSGEVILQDHDRAVWARVDELKGFDLAPADLPILSALLAGAAPATG